MECEGGSRTIPLREEAAARRSTGTQPSNGHWKQLSRVTVYTDALVANAKDSPDLAKKHVATLHRKASAKAIAIQWRIAFPEVGRLMESRLPWCTTGRDVTATETGTQAIATPDPSFTRNERPQKPAGRKRRDGPGNARAEPQQVARGPTKFGGRGPAKGRNRCGALSGIGFCPLLGTCTRGCPLTSFKTIFPDAAGF